MAGLNVGMKVIAIMPIMMLAMNGATVAVLYLGGKMVMAEGFLLGDLQAFINYIFQILMSVMMVAMALLQLTRAQACAHRINEVPPRNPLWKTSPRRSVPLRTSFLRPEAVWSSGTSHSNTPAPGRETMCSPKSASQWSPGQFVAIMGGTGTGKSSLVNLIPRFYDVTEGAVLAGRTGCAGLSPEQLRARIGMVLQSNVLFTGPSVKTFWGRPDATEEEMVQAAKDAQAYDFIMGLPDGFDTVLTQGGTNVSGGQKQRLCIARAMLRKPAVLILGSTPPPPWTAPQRPPSASPSPPI